jgi:hypothetical protein
MLNTKCDGCGKDARLVRQVIEYVRVMDGEIRDGDNLAVTKTTFIYECANCGSSKIVDALLPG